MKAVAKAPARKISVILADDHPIVRDGLAAIVNQQSDMHVVAEAGDGAEALDLYEQHMPDVMVLDLRMPKLDGAAVVQKVLEKHPKACLLIMTTYDGDEDIFRSLSQGAKGYLLKDVTLAQLVGAIRTVADGGSLVQPAVTQRLLSGLEHMRNEFVSLDRPDPLTDRETEILRLMASGFSNKEIANSLGVAEGTIKNHVSNILSKLGVRDRTRAVLKAFELQLV